MKKPFIRLNCFGDYLKIALCVALCLSALCLFRGRDKDIAVFSDKDNKAPKSFYSQLGSYL